ncbi:protein of unknown function [Pararobbsia alpina]
MPVDGGAILKLARIKRGAFQVGGTFSMRASGRHARILQLWFAGAFDRQRASRSPGNLAARRRRI